MNTVLWGICAAYFLLLTINVFEINDRVVKIVGVVSNVKNMRGGRSKFYHYEYHLQKESFFLKRNYLFIPSVMGLIERNKVKEGELISCFINKKDSQLEAYNIYIPIGLTVGTTCDKNLKYWLSLYAYVAKDIFHFIFLAIVILLCTYISKSPSVLQLKVMGIYFFILYFIL